MFQYKIETRNQTNERRARIETEKCKENNRINLFRKPRSTTREPLRNRRSNLATGSNKIEINRKRENQKEQETERSHDINCRKKARLYSVDYRKPESNSIANYETQNSILEQILNRLQKVEEKQGAPAHNFS